MSLEPSASAPGSQHQPAIGRQDGGKAQKQIFVKIGMSKKHQIYTPEN